MLTRLLVDNFRCLEGFEYRPQRRNLIIGRNGSGKSSLVDTLFVVRQFVANGNEAEGLFPLSQRTRWLNKEEQTFQLEVALANGKYEYQLVVEPSGDPPRPGVRSEVLYLNGEPLLTFVHGELELRSDDYSAAYSLERNRSALLTIPEKARSIQVFKHWLGSLYTFRLNPFAMGLRAEGENLYPNLDLSNIAAWYRHLHQDDPREDSQFLKSLQSAIDGLNFLELEHAGENLRLLVADFGSNVKLGFNQLSDGQRCLFCLYVILHFVLAKGSTVIIDEPENFISLTEIQPWLMKVDDVIEEGKGQILLITHHPELINQWAPNYGVQFVRNEAGSIRVEPFHGDPNSSLPPAELVARGWECE